MIRNASPRVRALITRIQSEIVIDETRISKELAQHASRYAYWAAAHAIKLSEYLECKDRLDRKEAELSKLINTCLIKSKSENSSVKTSDKIVKDAVLRNPEYQEIQKELVELKLEESVLDGAKRGFQQRGQALLEMARNERNELTSPEAVYTRKLIKESGLAE